MLLVRRVASGRYSMKRSLEVFQAEWYEMQQSGKFKARWPPWALKYSFANSVFGHVVRSSMLAPESV